MKRLIAFLPATLALIALLGVAVGLIVPAVRQIQVIRAATLAEREQLEHRYQRGRNRSRAALALAEREQVLASLSKRIPPEREALAVVRSIEAIATRQHLEERIAIDWSTARKENHIVEVPTTIELSGAYPNLIAALRDLERMPLPIAVEWFDVTSGARVGFGPPAQKTRVQLIIRTSTLWQ